MWFLLATVILVLLFGAGTPAVNAIRALQAEHPTAAKVDSENGELASDATLGSKRFGSLHNIAEHAATVQAGASSPPPPKPEALVTPTAVATPGAADVDEIIKIELTVNGQPMAVRLKLLPRHSPSSVEFVRHAAASRCRGELYRSENHFLVQGRISCSALPDGPKVPQVIKGQCPLGVKVEGRQCPSHDPQCGCHGPIMSKGMVGWAGGSAGPDFFIYTAHMDLNRCAVRGCPATHWSHDHTVFAEVADEETWKTLAALYALPVKKGGMTFFDPKLPLVVSK